MTVTMVLDAGLGDSGKGKIAAFLAIARAFRHVVNGGSGPSASHVIELAGERSHTVSQVPVGFVAPQATLYIGPGTLIDEPALRAELAGLCRYRARSRLVADRRCGLIADDAVRRERQHGLHDLGLRWEAGTTAARVDYLWRRARRLGDLDSPPCRTGDVPALLNDAARTQDVLVVGAHGPAYSLFTSPFYPLTTCDECSAAATLSRTGVAWRRLTSVIAVVNMMPTVTLPVPLAHELPLAEIRRRGLESYGAISGLRRRVAARPDMKELRRLMHLEQPTELALGRADLYDPAIRGARERGGLSAAVLSWIDRAEDDLGLPVSLVSTGPGVHDVVELC